MIKIIMIIIGLNKDFLCKQCGVAYAGITHPYIYIHMNNSELQVLNLWGKQDACLKECNLK